MADNLPAHLLNRPSRGITAAAASGMGGARPAHISRMGNRFTLIDNAGNSKPVMLMGDKGPYIDVIVVDANPYPSRVYYANGYDEDNPSPPDCFSDNGTGPSTQSVQAQSRTCEECQWRAWGSATSKLDGKAIPACSTTKKLAVAVVGDPDEMVYEMVVPPGSWSDKTTGYRRYVNSVGAAMIGSRQCELSDVVTRIYFIANKMGIMGFEPVRMINADEADMIDAIWESGETERVCGKLDKARDPTLAITARPVQKVAPPSQSAITPPVQPTTTPPPPAPPITQQTAGVPLSQQAIQKRRRGRPPSTPTQQEVLPPQAPFIQQPSTLQSGGQVSTPALNGAGMAAPKSPDEALKAALAAAFPGTG
jgi:hypothetical protein